MNKGIIYFTFVLFSTEIIVLSSTSKSDRFDGIGVVKGIRSSDQICRCLRSIYNVFTYRSLIDILSFQKRDVL